MYFHYREQNATFTNRVVHVREMWWSCRYIRTKLSWRSIETIMSNEWKLDTDEKETMGYNIIIHIINNCQLFWVIAYFHRTNKRKLPCFRFELCFIELSGRFMYARRLKRSVMFRQQRNEDIQPIRRNTSPQTMMMVTGSICVYGQISLCKYRYRVESWNDKPYLETVSCGMCLVLRSLWRR